MCHSANELGEGGMMCPPRKVEPEQEHEQEQEQEQERRQGGDLRQNSMLERASLSRIFLQDGHVPAVSSFERS